MRDCDALQVNFFPIAYSFLAILLLLNLGFSYPLGGMAALLLSDAYLATRLTDDLDYVEYNLIELFATESWT